MANKISKIGKICCHLLGGFYTFLQRFVLLPIADVTSQCPALGRVRFGKVDGEKVDPVSVVTGNGCQRATYYAGLGGNARHRHTHKKQT